MTPEGLTSKDIIYVKSLKIKANLDQLRALRDTFDLEIIKRIKNEKKQFKINKFEETGEEDNGSVKLR